MSDEMSVQIDVTFIRTNDGEIATHWINASGHGKLAQLVGFGANKFSSDDIGWNADVGYGELEEIVRGMKATDRDLKSIVAAVNDESEKTEIFADAFRKNTLFGVLTGTPGLGLDVTELYALANDVEPSDVDPDNAYCSKSDMCKACVKIARRKDIEPETLLAELKQSLEDYKANNGYGGSSKSTGGTSETFTASSAISWALDQNWWSEVEKEAAKELVKECYAATDSRSEFEDKVGMEIIDLM